MCIYFLYKKQKLCILPHSLFTNRKKCGILDNGGPNGNVWLAFLFYNIVIGKQLS